MTRKRSAPKSVAEMAPLVAAWRRGEGTQPVLAARPGMPPSTFALWCQRIPAVAKRAPQFIPVDVRAEPRRGGGFELELGKGRLLRVPSGFDAAELRTLLSVLESTC